MNPPYDSTVRCFMVEAPPQPDSFTYKEGSRICENVRVSLQSVYNYCRSRLPHRNRGGGRLRVAASAIHDTCGSGPGGAVSPTLSHRTNPPIDRSAAGPCLSCNVGVQQATRPTVRRRADRSGERNEGQKFVVKTILADFEYYQDMQRALHPSCYLRLLEDTVPDKSMFIYRYFNDHLLSLAQRDLPLRITKGIMRDVLRGLAELHHQNIVHTGQSDRSLYI